MFKGSDLAPNARQVLCRAHQ